MASRCTVVSGESEFYHPDWGISTSSLVWHTLETTDIHQAVYNQGKSGMAEGKLVEAICMNAYYYSIASDV